MADDAGALLVRSGLVSANALEDARARVASAGGTLGEQLVTAGAITDDHLTDFYRSRLLVPQVNPNMLARLTPRVVAAIPSDMAIELRAIPVSLDNDNNLTIAMSDPSDRHAVDEIAFFTGAYIVRAVATQMQIAWCLAHYYGHVTALGQRLLYPSGSESPGQPASSAASPHAPRTKPLTGDLGAARPRAMAPVTGPVHVARPNSSELGVPPLAGPDAPARTPATALLEASVSTTGPASASAPASAVHPLPTAVTRPTAPGTPAEAPAASGDHTPLIIEVDDETTDDDEPAIRTPGSPDTLAASDNARDQPRARSASGEIRAPIRRAASIRPPMPAPESDDNEELLIVIEPGGLDDDTTDPRTRPHRRRAVKSDPPELYARAGEVQLKTDGDHAIEVDEPRIVIDEDALAPPASATARRDPAVAPVATNEALDDADTEAVIQDGVIDDVSQPILLERPRAAPDRLRPPPAAATPAAPDRARADTDETTVVVLDTFKDPRKTPRPERRTQVGIPPAPAPFRPRRDTEATGIPEMPEMPEIADHPELDQTAPVDDDATTLEILPALPAADPTSSEPRLAPRPGSDSETDPNLIAAPPRPAPTRPPAIPTAVIIEDAPGDEPDDGDGEPSGRRSSVMTDVELGEAIPGRASEVVPAPLSRRHGNHDPVDDGWGPPGTTIPPPLLGAIPGSDDDGGDHEPSAIPMPNVDSSPLLVAPSSLPSPRDAGEGTLVRALEQATAMAISVIRQLERARSRDEVVDVMITHLAETHHRAGFFVMRHTATKGETELGLFSMRPKPEVTPFATLRLDRPSTLQDVVGTRLPYRGPMHDDASRTFLIAILGACPPEILLVPVAVRERVVGVLFGEHRHRHTFDDQLALAARAAGMALERILKAKRG